jgi:hypothetical protein
MNRSAVVNLASMLVLAGGGLAQTANAATQVVTFNVLNASATLGSPFDGGDNLRLNTLVTSEVGSLVQSITFTVGPDVGSLVGEAAWEVSSSTGTGPRLVGVNIDIFDASNTLVTSDSFQGVLGGFAVSTFASAIGPGTYRIVATGTAEREASLDATLSFVNVVPEPQTLMLMFAGLGVIGYIAARRRG